MNAKLVLSGFGPGSEVIVIHEYARRTRKRKDTSRRGFSRHAWVGESNSKSAYRVTSHITRYIHGATRNGHAIILFLHCHSDEWT